MNIGEFLIKQYTKKNQRIILWFFLYLKLINCFMNPEEKKQLKNDNLIKFWETKRDNRVKYAILQSLYFAIPFSVVFQALESLHGFFSLNFAFIFITIFSVYFLLTYYVSFKIYEKKYQKIKKQL
jgi:hypothetical protein